ncbi:putative serine peptidase, Clan S-, family S54, partial [Trypanosoma grayi]|uniref:putative serine peptidase, Clan S-, family S54 n=1 Tax=Trypanosoma grayi TaxID=71804 RepID=UPI0004F45019
MVHVDLTCAAIRLTPVWICIAAHCSNGDWPTSLEAAIRVIDYGFSMETFRRRPEVLLTHLFVHANDAHLRGNMAALVTTLIGFGGSSVEENLMETSITKCIRRTLSSLVVFIGGGIIGGLGGQLLFNDAQRKRRYGGWLTAPALRESAAGGVSPVSAIAE